MSCAYPPRFLTQHTKQRLNILQLTDLHLPKSKSKLFFDQNCHQNFEKLLSQALNDKFDCDLIILTGDIIHEMDNNIYDDVIQILQNTNIPFVLISGNHDVTDEIGDDLPFYEKEFLPYNPDIRLISNHVIESEHWQIVLLDSSVPGKVSGYIDSQDIIWLQNHLIHNHKPTLICLHHHLIPMQSHWIDNHITLNANEFWQNLDQFTQVKGIIHGHVHQEFYAKHNDIEVFAAPATSYQFKPQQHDFMIDTDSKPGYQWLFLNNDGTIENRVHRLD